VTPPRRASFDTNGDLGGSLFAVGDYAFFA
jgi:hypothetical protein